MNTHVALGAAVAVQMFSIPTATKKISMSEVSKWFGWVGGWVRTPILYIIDLAHRKESYNGGADCHLVNQLEGYWILQSSPTNNHQSVSNKGSVTCHTNWHPIKALRLCCNMRILHKNFFTSMPYPQTCFMISVEQLAKITSTNKITAFSRLTDIKVSNRNLTERFTHYCQDKKGSPCMCSFHYIFPKRFQVKYQKVFSSDVSICSSSTMKSWAINLT